jgi:hypothetical protein
MKFQIALECALFQQFCTHKGTSQFEALSVEFIQKKVLQQKNDTIFKSIVAMIG